MTRTASGEGNLDNPDVLNDYAVERIEQPVRQSFLKKQICVREDLRPVQQASQTQGEQTVGDEFSA